jgi:mannose-6-phosphate isomerase
VYPLIFHPRFKERVWGGRRLEALYGKALPPGVRIGESWEISDRPGDESVVANGPLAGRTLRSLMEEHAAALLGSARPAREGRFPLLCKILDARDTLSLQVHPPPHRAGGLGGEPKTEMWYIAEASDGAELFAGLRRGITRDQFEAAARSGEVAELFHRLPVRAGDAMFLPSGRVHAIGAGLVIFEIQQNSDTTYRVFDWNRVGLDGRPRELHLAESMASIDFEDVEPELVSAPVVDEGALGRQALVRDPLFHVDLCEGRAHGTKRLAGGSPSVVAVIAGRVIAAGGGVPLPLRPGDFAVLPASLDEATLTFEPSSRFLTVALPS